VLSLPEGNTGLHDRRLFSSLRSCELLVAYMPRATSSGGSSSCPQCFIDTWMCRMGACSSNVAALNADVWCGVTGFLGHRDVLVLASTCSRLAQVCTGNGVWEWLLTRDLPADYLAMAASRHLGWFAADGLPAAKAPDEMIRAYFRILRQMPRTQAPVPADAQVMGSLDRLFRLPLPLSSHPLRQARYLWAGIARSLFRSGLHFSDDWHLLWHMKWTLAPTLAAIAPSWNLENISRRAAISVARLRPSTMHEAVRVAPTEAGVRHRALKRWAVLIGFTAACERLRHRRLRRCLQYIGSCLVVVALSAFVRGVGLPPAADAVWPGVSAWSAHSMQYLRRSFCESGMATFRQLVRFPDFVIDALITDIGSRDIGIRTADDFLASIDNTSPMIPAVLSDLVEQYVMPALVDTSRAAAAVASLSSAALLVATSCNEYKRVALARREVAINERFVEGPLVPFVASGLLSAATDFIVTATLLHPAVVQPVFATLIMFYVLVLQSISAPPLGIIACVAAVNTLSSDPISRHDMGALTFVAALCSVVSVGIRAVVRARPYDWSLERTRDDINVLSTLARMVVMSVPAILRNMRSQQPVAWLTPAATSDEEVVQPAGVFYALWARPLTGPRPKPGFSGVLAGLSVHLLTGSWNYAAAASSVATLLQSAAMYVARYAAYRRQNALCL
jgi:hypothetical protein